MLELLLFLRTLCLYTIGGYSRKSQTDALYAASDWSTSKISNKKPEGC
jgi:hypothetical protein